MDYEHTLAWCCGSFSVICKGCGVYTCTACSDCERCSDAMLAWDKVLSGGEVSFAEIKITHQDIDKTLADDLRTRPECVGAEDPEWLENELSEAKKHAEWAHSVLAKLTK